MTHSKPFTATIDIDRATEFTGDDVDRFSDLIDLEDVYEFVLVYVPEITSSTVTLYIQRNDQVDTIHLAMNILDDDATGSFAHATSAGTGSIAIIFRVGAAQFVRVYAGSKQAADRSFTLIGFKR